MIDIRHPRWKGTIEPRFSQLETMLVYPDRTYRKSGQHPPDPCNPRQPTAIATSLHLPKHGKSLGGGIDIDSTVHHGASRSADGLIPSIDEITVPWLDVITSTRGAGRHLYMWFDGDMPDTPTRAHHSALINSLIPAASEYTSIPLTGNVDCAGRMMWIYKDNQAPDGFRLVKAATEPFPVSLIPANWAETVPATRTQARGHSPGERPGSLTANQERHFDAIDAEDGAGYWDSDSKTGEPGYVTHQVLSAKHGGPPTDSPGSDLHGQNCIEYPEDGGSIRQVRLGSGEVMSFYPYEAPLDMENLEAVKPDLSGLFPEAPDPAEKALSVFGAMTVREFRATGKSEVPCIVANAVARLRSTTCGGLSQSLKSCFGTDLCASVAAAIDHDACWLNYEGFEVLEPCPVFTTAPAEPGMAEIAHLIDRICKARGFDPFKVEDNIIFGDMVVSLDTDGVLDHLDKIVTRYGVKLVHFDPMYKFTGAKDNYNMRDVAKELQKITSWCTARDITLYLSHHFNEGSRGKTWPDINDFHGAGFQQHSRTKHLIAHQGFSKGLHRVNMKIQSSSHFGGRYQIEVFEDVDFSKWEVTVRNYDTEVVKQQQDEADKDRAKIKKQVLGLIRQNKLSKTKLLKKAFDEFGISSPDFKIAWNDMKDQLEEVKEGKHIHYVIKGNDYDM